jgi:hypothetical protein
MTRQQSDYYTKSFPVSHEGAVPAGNGERETFIIDIAEDDCREWNNAGVTASAACAATKASG